MYTYIDNSVLIIIFYVIEVKLVNAFLLRKNWTFFFYTVLQSYTSARSDYMV